MPAPPQAWLRRHLVWAAVVVAYLIVFPYFAQVNNPNENVRVWATRAIAHHGTFAIDPVMHEWGDVGDRAAAGGQRYSSKAPGTSLLGVPVHFVHDRLARALTGASPSLRASTWALRVFTVVLPMALFLLLFGRRVESESGSPLARDLLTLGVGLGTLLYPYGLTFVGHAQSAALLFIGFLALTPGNAYATAHDPETGRAPSRALPKARLTVAGLLVGLSVVFEYQTLLAAAVVGLYAVWRVRRQLPSLLWFGAGGAGAGAAAGGVPPGAVRQPAGVPLRPPRRRGLSPVPPRPGLHGAGAAAGAGDRLGARSASTTACSCSRRSWRWDCWWRWRRWCAGGRARRCPRTP